MEDFVDFLGFINQQLNTKDLPRLESFLMPANFSSMVGEFMSATIPKYCRTLAKNTFIQSHWDLLGAIDFTTIEVWTKGGLVTFYLLFVMELATRRVHFAGCTPNPDEAWMMQIARNLTDAEDGFPKGKRYVLMDRDGKFSPAFQAILKTEDVEAMVLPPQSPNLNAHLERFHRSLKEECVERMIFFGEAALWNAVREFLAHYDGERNHQGMGNRIPVPSEEVGRICGEIQCRERVGGRLRYYHQKEA